MSWLKNQFWTILKHYLNHFVTDPEKDSFIRPLPLFNVNIPVSLICCWRNSRWWRIEFDSIKIAFEVLKKNDFLLQFRRISWEIEMRTQVVQVFFIRRAFSFDVHKVVIVFMKNHLCTIIVENHVAVIWQFCSNTILWRIVNPFLNEDFICVKRSQRWCVFTFYLILIIVSFFWSLSF